MANSPLVSLEKFKLFTIIPTVQATPDYTAGDVLFAPTEIPNFFPSTGASCILKSITIIDSRLFQLTSLHYTLHIHQLH